MYTVHSKNSMYDGYKYSCVLTYKNKYTHVAVYVALGLSRNDLIIISYESTYLTTTTCIHHLS